MGFKEKLKEIRKETRLSQEKFAEQINVSRQAVTKWECGEAYPDIEKLIEISNVFKISIDRLLKDEESCTEKIGREKNELISKKDRKEIIKFLCKAKKETYAGSNNKSESSRPNSSDLKYSEKDLLYIDTYLGSEKFIGEEGIWIENIPYWGMNYFGKVIDKGFSGSFLKEVLLNVEEDLPYRGPIMYKKGDYVYHCMIEGDFTFFKGKEEIHLKNKKIYECIFHGGILK